MLPIMEFHDKEYEIIYTFLDPSFMINLLISLNVENIRVIKLTTDAIEKAIEVSGSEVSN